MFLCPFYDLFLLAIVFVGCTCVCVFGHFSHLEKGVYPSYEGRKKTESTFPQN